MTESGLFVGWGLEHASVYVVSDIGGRPPEAPRPRIAYNELPFSCLRDAGKNYGWSRFESSLCSDHNENLQGNPPCTTGDQSRQGFEFPIFEVRSVSCLRASTNSTK